MIVLTSLRHPQVGDVNASIFVVSPVANATLKSSMNARAVARTCVAMTLADVGVTDALPVLLGVPLLVGLALALSAAFDGSAGRGDGGIGGAADEGGIATAGAELAVPSAVGWLTFAEQPVSNTTPISRQAWVPRRYPTGGGYGRRDG